MQGQLFSTATSRMACPALRRTKTSGRSVQSACRVRAGTRSSDLRAALDATGHWYRPPFLKIVQIIPTPLERSVCFPLIRTNIPKEVVLTFDDGPVPRYSNQILDILATQCVKATFFLVGEMARAHPSNSAPDFRGRSYHRHP